MKVLGVAIKKGELRYAVIEGSSKKDCKIVASDKYIFRAESNTAELMNTFENNFNELITKYRPVSIAYKLSLNPNMNQMKYLQFPIGVLNLVCFKKECKVSERSVSWIVAGKRKKLEACSKYFSDYKQNLKGIELEAILVAWFEFGD